MSKDGTNRGGCRPGAGRKPKALTEKLASGNPGGRKLTTLDFACDAAGEGVPEIEAEGRQRYLCRGDFQGNLAVAAGAEMRPADSNPADRAVCHVCGSLDSM